MAKCCGIIKCVVHCESSFNKMRRQVCYSCTNPYYCSIPLEDGDFIIDVNKVIFKDEILLEVMTPFTKMELCQLNLVDEPDAETYVDVLKSGRMFELDFYNITKCIDCTKDSKSEPKMSDVREIIHSCMRLSSESIAKMVMFGFPPVRDQLPFYHDDSIC